jgi:hypothetical protein
MDRVGTVVPQCILRLEATGVHHLAALSVKIPYEFQQAHRSNRFRLVGGPGVCNCPLQASSPLALFDLLLGRWRTMVYIL